MTEPLATWKWRKEQMLNLGTRAHEHAETDRERQTEAERQKNAKTTPKEHRGSRSPIHSLQGSLQELWGLYSQMKPQGMTMNENYVMRGWVHWGFSFASPKVMGRTGNTKLTHCKLHLKKKEKKKDVSLI